MNNNTFSQDLKTNIFKIDQNRERLLKGIDEIIGLVNNTFKNNIDEKIKQLNQGNDFNAQIEKLDPGFHQHIETVAFSLYLLKQSIRKIVETEQQLLKTPQNEPSKIVNIINGYDKNYNYRYDYDYKLILIGFLSHIRQYLVRYMTEYNYENNYKL